MRQPARRAPDGGSGEDANTPTVGTPTVDLEWCGPVRPRGGGRAVTRPQGAGPTEPDEGHGSADPAGASTGRARPQGPPHQQASRGGLPGRPVRARLHDAPRAPGGDGPLRPVHRQAGEPGDAGALRALPRRPGLRAGRPERARGDDPHRRGSSGRRPGRSPGSGVALVERHGGQVPSTLDDLVALPGVGRKTANVVLGDAFGIPGITVDTHVGRLVRRWGWTTSDDPVVVEREIGCSRRAARVDAVLAPGDLPRAACLLRAAPGLRCVPDHGPVPVGGDRGVGSRRGRGARQDVVSATSARSGVGRRT